MERNVSLKKSAYVSLFLTCLGFFTLCLTQTGFAVEVVWDGGGTLPQYSHGHNGDNSGDGGSGGNGNGGNHGNAGGAVGFTPQGHGGAQEHSPVYPIRPRTDILGQRYVPLYRLGLRRAPEDWLSQVQTAWRGGYEYPVVSVDSNKGRQIAARARNVMWEYNFRGVKYRLGQDASHGGRRSDCSHFVHDVLGQEGLDIPYVTAQETDVSIAKSPYFDRIDDPKDVRPGDVIVAVDVLHEVDGHMEYSGAHMGIVASKQKPDGTIRGIQMGEHGARNVPWGTKTGIAAKHFYYYRPKS